MNCCYLPNPSRTWSRVQSNCTYYDASYNPNAEIVSPLTGKLITASQYAHEIAMLNKGNILQYKNNSGCLTQKQRYSKIAQGKWVNRNTTWASQSTRGYSNPNTQGLKRVGSINITLDGVPTNLPVTCPPYTPDSVIVIQDLGNLICSATENICTGETTVQPATIPCHPTSDSDVPGRIQLLCWNERIHPWYPRQRYIMGSSGNKFPTNYKGLVSATTPCPK